MESIIDEELVIFSSRRYRKSMDSERRFEQQKSVLILDKARKSLRSS